MAAISCDREVDPLLSSFDQIYEDFKNGTREMQVVKANLYAEIKKREALELISNSLKQENARLTKLYGESLNNLAEELERRTRCSSLQEELERIRNEQFSKEKEHRDALEFLKQEYTIKIAELESQNRGFLLEKAADEATISHLRHDLSAEKTFTQSVTKRLEQVSYEMESKFILEIQDLKDCLLVEQEEKNEFSKKLCSLEKELLVSKTKLVEQQQDLIADRLVETLKQKIMNLRKENEVLKRKLSHSEKG
ncbi:hypothetical protein K2173_003820 [Erythroxylum novogranatense]|uniref:Protein At-4/1-like n=1 Tax=Erythroxylum novogranatense TaxID=1862640 RepID=A0AAV8SIW4_9ROSI|nr:hypothetical protein K2173_003820 [Erythroxylum novogranatense]